MSTTRTRKTKVAAPDTCRLELSIRGARYALRPLPNPEGRAWRLRKGDGTAYHVGETMHGPTCDCGDFVWRRDGLDFRMCKHIRALRVLGLIGRGDVPHPIGEGDGRPATRGMPGRPRGAATNTGTR